MLLKAEKIEDDEQHRPEKADVVFVKKVLINALTHHVNGFILALRNCKNTVNKYVYFANKLLRQGGEHHDSYSTSDSRYRRNFSNYSALLYLWRKEG